MTPRMSLFVAALALGVLAWAMVGCREGRGGDGDGDADADTDADQSDGDLDADATGDGDLGGDGDQDSDQDAEPDSDPEPDVECSHGTCEAITHGCTCDWTCGEAIVRVWCSFYSEPWQCDCTGDEVMDCILRPGSSTPSRCGDDTCCRF